MLRRIRNNKWCKAISIGIAMNFMLELCLPLRSMALTGGPSQPEMEAFTPVNTNDMVDLASGDFRYNIPLLTVPGPNGGYPINLAYNAGITMEQEASWVGLGWNINPGSITRNMRGIPDEFNGDIITKKYHTKPNWTVGVGLSDLDLEAIGIPSLPATGSAQLYYNSYKGFGIKVGMGINALQSDCMGGSIKGDVDLSWDSQSGLGFSPSLSVAGSMEQKKSTTYAGTLGSSGSIGITVNSRQGVTDLWLKSTTSASYQNLKKNMPTLGVSDVGAGFSFGTSSYVPSVQMPMRSFSIGGNVKLGPSAVMFADAKVNANFSRQEPKKEPVLTPAYGLLYHQNGGSDGMKDFNREKDVAVNKHSKNLPIPVMTYDIFQVTGENMGGAFRIYRSDIPLFTDPITAYNTGDGEIGFDLGSLGVANHLGVNLSLGITENYSGMWQDGCIDAKKVFNQNDNSNPVSEQAYFRMTGDNAENNLEQFNDVLKSDPARFALDINNKVPYFHNILNDNSRISKPYRTAREKRSKTIEYLTNKEKAIDPVKENYFESNQDVLKDSPKPFQYTRPSHHLAEMTVTNPDGNKYTYGIAAYNNSQRDDNFAVPALTNNKKFFTSAIEDYDSPNNKQGDDNLFMSTEMPAYAHSYLLTKIVAPDYVDVDNNGPSDNDLGYWAKFTYKKQHSDYKWRIPYTGANYSKGFITDEKDDKASYTYGTKEIWYLQKVETKTHCAIFYFSNREDGLDAFGPCSYPGNASGFKGTNRLLKIDSIGLYSKVDITIPVKMVHFEYTYDLCGKVQNNQGKEIIKKVLNKEININRNAGKLTLKCVWFSYEKNRKGRFSPYVFNYNELGSDGQPDQINNPDYSALAMDRWGYYAADQDVSIWPYVSQKAADAQTIDNYMGVWNLKEIHLPSGAKIRIDYESDDYAYVQNKRAMQMMKITSATWNKNEENPLSGIFTLTVDKNKAEDKAADYIDKLRDDLVYFKCYVLVKGSPDKGKYDYVEGYGAYNTCVANGSKLNITFKQVPYNLITQKTDPITLATWQYLKLQRPDLLYDKTIESDVGFLAIVNKVCALLKDISTLLIGFYNYCNGTQLGKDISISNQYPSYIRLNNPDMIKRGGGHRVKQISMIDNWTQPWNAAFTTSYTYRTYENGRIISSGVAENEPSVGAEESPLKHPVRYHLEKIFPAKSPELYLEEPFGESLYPGPSVTYSKVIVHTDLPTEEPHTPGVASQNGIQVAEFFTSRDFPVRSSQTEIQLVKHKPFPIQWPTIGYNVYTSHGFSQGYTIELNDMQGKQKKLATYKPWNYKEITDFLMPDFNMQPVSLVEYIYKTRYPYVPGGDNQLENTVTVLHGDNAKQQGTIGLTYDFYTDMRENYTYCFSGEMLPNLDQMTFIVLPMIWPKKEQSTSIFRTIVNMKVVCRTGILEETRSYKDGALTATKNLMYDSETGEPLLTVTTSDFSNSHAANLYNYPYYTYTMPAHWYYPMMGGKYHNAGANYDAEKQYKSVPGKKDTVNFKPGDIILGTGKYWLTSNTRPADPKLNYFSLGNSAGSSIASLQGRVVSGYTNQLSVNAGNIVSLKNPVDERWFPLFDAYNADYLPFSTYANGFAKKLIYTDCSGKIDTACVLVDIVNNIIEFIKIKDKCQKSSSGEPGGNPSGIGSLYNLNGSTLTLEPSANGTLIYNKTVITGPFVVNNFNASLLSAVSTQGNSNVQVTYTVSGNSVNPGSSTATIASKSGNVSAFSVVNPGKANQQNAKLMNTGNMGSISGHVFLDLNGLTDNTVNGIGTNYSGTLYINQVNKGNGTVSGVTPVNSDGTYKFVNVTTGTQVDLVLSTSQGIVGQQFPVHAAANYINTGEHLGAGSGSDPQPDGILSVSYSDSEVAEANFGIIYPVAVENVVDANCTCPLKEQDQTCCYHCRAIVKFPDSLKGINQLNLMVSKLTKAGNKVILETNAHRTYTGSWSDTSNCFRECMEVLNAKATEFSQNWTYTYPDFGITTGDPFPLNHYAGGRKGIYRVKRENVYYIERKQRSGDPALTNPQTNIQEDGIYDYFSFFNWQHDNKTNGQFPWVWASEVTKYSPFGFDVENRNALNIYSAALYGYGQSLATAVANNAMYEEIAFDGYEDHTTGKSNGHFQYSATGINSQIQNVESHTGDKAVKITGSLDFSGTIPSLSLHPKQKYIFSGWIKRSNQLKQVKLQINSTNIPFVLENPVEGWQRFEVSFIPAGSTVNIKLSTDAPSTFYLDDIRLMPFNASMKTYVYDPAKLRTVAILDENNYATFYNYDEEGTLVQVKKETERGIMTLKTTRQHIMRNKEIR
ncbi:MAG: hypothetical protein Q8M08_12565 [Bacteroidales bacterium]|nr:hypothetical protein [Bacteroidales bacterium]